MPGAVKSSRRVIVGGAVGAAVGLSCFLIAVVAFNITPLVLWPIALPLTLVARYSVSPYILGIGVVSYYTLLACIFIWVTGRQNNYSRLSGWGLLMLVLVIHIVVYRIYLSHIHGEAVTVIMDAVSKKTTSGLQSR